jgi:hypothetical protein
MGKARSILAGREAPWERTLNRTSFAGACVGIMIAAFAADTHRTPRNGAWDGAVLLDGGVPVASGRSPAPRFAVASGDDRAWIEERLRDEGCCGPEREAAKETNE